MAVTRFFIVLNLSALFTLGSPAVSGQSISIGICDASVSVAANTETRRFYDAEGAEKLLLVSPDNLDEEQCDSATINSGTGSIIWAGPLPLNQQQLNQNRFTLIGTFTTESARVSEIIGSQPASTSVIAIKATRAEPGKNLLRDFDVIQFGIEERANWLEGYHLYCEPGEMVAGFQLQTPFEWPQDMQLQITGSGIGTFEIAVADAQRIANESALPLGAFTLEGQANRERVNFSLPASTSPWSALTLLCPQTAGIIQIDSIVLKPFTTNDHHNRAAWVWNPGTWLREPDSFWELQALEDIDEFFITVPVGSDGEVENARELHNFIATAYARNLKIWAVIGDHRDVLPDSLLALQTRIAAYRRYNERSNDNSKLAGVQLDIEPYLLPGQNLATDHWRLRYLETVQTAHLTAGVNLALDLVMPVWWGTHIDWGDKLLDQLTLDNISLTIMNYRTNYEALQAGALPFLNWGLRQQKPVRIALETGTLGDQSQRFYFPANAAGELWSMQVGATAILVLFKTPQEGLPGRPFSLREQRAMPASNITFGGDQRRLNELANRLSEEWRSWDSFAGLALHGLDEVYAGEDEN